MRRALVLMVLLAATGARAGEGVYITIDGGYSIWNKDTLKTNLTKQVGATNAALLTDNQMPDGGIFALHLGYNIGGHVAFEGSFSIHPWDILQKDQGAVGFVGAATRWFPLQGLLRPNRPADFSLLAGVDYYLLGGGGVLAPGASDVTKNTSRGMDGMAFEFGATFELYPARWVSLGITPRLYNLHPLRYFTSFDNRDTGGQIPLTGNVGGSMFGITLSVTFHFEPLPD
jgi:hypothetical protein